MEILQDRVLNGQISLFEQKVQKIKQNCFEFKDSEEFYLHFSTFKKFFNKKRLILLWIQKIFQNLSGAQVLIEETTKVIFQLRNFERNLREKFERIFKSSFSTDEETEECKIKEFEKMLENIKEFLSKRLKHYFEENQAKMNKSVPLIKKETKSNFVKPNQVLLSILNEIVSLMSIIENELKELWSNKYYIKIYIQNFSFDTLEGLQKEYESIISNEFFSSFLDYHKFIHPSLEAMKVMESIVKEFHDRFKEKNILEKKKSISFSLKILEKNDVDLYSSKSFTNINSYQNSSTTIEKTYFSSRTSSISFCKCYEENKAILSFTLEGIEIDDQSKKEKKESEREKNQGKPFFCNFLRC